ncbi:MAG: response regulator [Deltaproteobacteria bacterium]|nr:response regulator [Deltaproteobacteria bacterium]
MEKKRSLQGKRILVVDDEKDILIAVKELLDACEVDTASDFETARDLLEKNPYDAAILDIMGVRGYELLALATQKDIPTLMLTAHALSPDNFVRSVQNGAGAYVPKDKLADIEIFLMDVLEAHEKGEKGLGRWFARLEDFYEKKFGEYWKEKSGPDFWKKYY